MKPFRSSIQALLTLRQRAEQEALEAYARALLARQAALEALSAVHAQQNAWWARRRTELDRGCSAAFLAQWSAVDAGLREQRDRAQAALTEAEVNVNQKLQRMLQVRCDREAAETYIQRQRALHNRELNREEQKTLDDLGARRSTALRSWSRASSPNP